MGLPGTHSPGANPRVGGHSGAPPVTMPDERALEHDAAPDPEDAARPAVRQPDGPPMEPPRPVLALIGVVGLGILIGPFVLAFMLMSQPEAPPGAVNISPAAQQPIRDAQGEPLAVQPGEPEEGEALVNVPPSPTGEQPAPTQAAPPKTPPVATTTQALPDEARSGAPTTTPPAPTQPQ